jgi:hypothetical protein
MLAVGIKLEPIVKKLEESISLDILDIKTLKQARALNLFQSQGLIDQIDALPNNTTFEVISATYVNLQYQEAQIHNVYQIIAYNKLEQLKPVLAVLKNIGDEAKVVLNSKSLDKKTLESLKQKINQSTISDSLDIKRIVNGIPIGGLNPTDQKYKDLKKSLEDLLKDYHNWLHLYNQGSQQLSETI